MRSRGARQHHLRGRPRARPGAAARRRAAATAQTELALRVLAAQQFLDSLPTLLPEGVWHGNKTGELHGIRHDMMLVAAGGSWASVAVTATGLADDVTGADRGSLVLPTFARVGELVASRLHDAS